MTTLIFVLTIIEIYVICETHFIFTVYNYILNKKNKIATRDADRMSILIESYYSVSYVFIVLFVFLKYINVTLLQENTIMEIVLIFLTSFYYYMQKYPIGELIKISFK